MNLSKAIVILLFIVPSLLAESIAIEISNEICYSDHECFYDSVCVLKNVIGIEATAVFFAPRIVNWTLNIMGFGPISSTILWPNSIGLVKLGSLFATIQANEVSHTNIFGFGPSIVTAITTSCSCNCMRRKNNFEGQKSN